MTNNKAKPFKVFPTGEDLDGVTTTNQMQPLQNPNPKNPFSGILVTTPPETELLKAIEKEEQDAKDRIKEAYIALEQAADVRDKLRNENEVKLREQRNALLEQARLYRQAAATKPTPDETVAYIKLAEAAEQEAYAILPSTDAEATPEPIRFLGISTTKGLLSLGALGALATVLFWATGTALVTDAENDSALRMMNSVGLRILTNFLPFILSFLVSAGMIWLLFPSIFHYWHNRIKSEVSLLEDLNKATPWQRLAFFSFSIALPVWAYVMLMQVVFG
jgi:hypothetical protein